jgi:hypothetical protein
MQNPEKYIKALREGDDMAALNLAELWRSAEIPAIRTELTSAVSCRALEKLLTSTGLEDSEVQGQEDDSEVEIVEPQP